MYVTVLVEGEAVRLAEGVWLQRVACSACWKSWTLRPRWLYPHRSYAPDVVEAASLSYLTEANATYAAVSTRYGCSWTAIWTWISALAGMEEPAALLAEAARLQPAAPTVELIPRAVPQSHPKGRSPERQSLLLRVLQFLAALVVLGRTHDVPSADPSPLRGHLVLAFLHRRDRALVTRPGWSPTIDVVHRGPPRR